MFTFLVVRDDYVTVLTNQMEVKSNSSFWVVLCVKRGIDRPDISSSIPIA